MTKERADFITHTAADEVLELRKVKQELIEALEVIGGLAIEGDKDRVIVITAVEAIAKVSR